MQDLFNNPEEQTEELKLILKKWEAKICNGLSYKQCEELQKEVLQVGYTFEFGLSAEPYNLKQEVDNFAVKIEIIEICKAFNLGDFIESKILSIKNGYTKTKFLTSKGAYTHFFKNPQGPTEDFLLKYKKHLES